MPEYSVLVPLDWRFLVGWMYSFPGVGFFFSFFSFLLGWAFGTLVFLLSTFDSLLYSLFVSNWVWIWVGGVNGCVFLFRFCFPFSLDGMGIRNFGWMGNCILVLQMRAVLCRSGNGLKWIEVY
ncbi:hypothetical protein BZA05DRAFT_207060 [Tricharina praecox]|uniref:uncharacterized protein n=1 Tax=Tricharina praecox TaxID=43433 RepID=UPI00221EC309|nr:uncharacterized protein BZA05DRAFT_207060 [Tricharina praecox]KAI5842061.1 hypothetical protein BZA05DRAFT_207060 [Tricharina praecox]